MKNQVNFPNHAGWKPVQTNSGSLIFSSGKCTPKWAIPLQRIRRLL